MISFKALWPSKIRSVLFSLLGTLVLFGCVLNAPPPRNSRFSVDISDMTKADFLHDTWIYRHPTKKVLDYSSFLVSPVKVFSNPVKKISDESRTRYNQLAMKLESDVKKMLSKNSRLADQPGRDVLQLKLAVIDIKPIVHMMKDGNEVRVSNPDIRGTKFDLDVADSESGELIYAISTLYKGDDYAQFEDPALAPRLEKESVSWISFLSDRLNEQRQTKP